MTTQLLETFFILPLAFLKNPPKMLENESLLVDSEEFNPVVVLCCNQHVPIFQIVVFASDFVGLRPDRISGTQPAGFKRHGAGGFEAG